MKKIVKRAKRGIEAGEDTPLRIGELAQFFEISPWKIYVSMSRGYQFAYGKETTARHYRAWLEANPLPRRQRKNRGEKPMLARELSRLS